MLRLCFPLFARTDKAKLSHVVRERVWNHYIGRIKGESRCFCCEKNLITPFHFECAHIIADSKGGSNELNNLLPACSQCNRSMGTMNFFVFKSSLLDKFHFNENIMSEEKKNVSKFYKYHEEHLTCKNYLENFDSLLKIVKKNMATYSILKKTYTMHKMRCKCGFRFSYLVYKNNDFALTCKSSKQNLIDVICDHMPCLINKKRFISGTINTKCFGLWEKYNNKK